MDKQACVVPLYDEDGIWDLNIKYTIFHKMFLLEEENFMIQTLIFQDELKINHLVLILI